MSLPVPLGVVVTTSRTCKVITKDLRSLSFRSVAPGGFAGATFSLHRPLRLSPDEMAYYAKVEVIDTRSGLVVSEGRLEDPGKSASGDGEIWDVTAVGNMSHTKDRTVPVIYVDAASDKWERASYSSRSAEISINERSADDDSNPAVLISAPDGITTPTGWQGEARYRAIRDAGMTLARVRVNVVNGVATANYENRLTTAVGSGSRTNAVTSNFDTAANTLTGVINGGNNIPSGNDVAWIRIVRTGSLASGTDSTWAEYYDIAVRAVLKDSSGTDITSSGSYTTNHVLASEIVNDLIGRLLTKYEATSVATTSTPIYQLAYPDGITPSDLLDDLMLLEPSYYWAAWESANTASGKIRFEWKQWPSTVRYEASVNDGFDSVGSADGLYDKVRVRWVDQRGRPRTTSASQTVQELTDAGLTREALIDLGSDTGSGNNATQAANQFLAEHASPRNGGTLTVAQKVMDLSQGWKVQPWEIRPGELIRVKGVAANADVLNATSRNGSTVFRIVGVEYDAGSATARLELDDFPYNTARAIATLRSQMYSLYKLRRR